MSRLGIMLAVAAFSALACASGTQGGTRSTGSRNLISAEQIAESLEGSVYDVIRRVRPAWLRPRSGNVAPVVFVDNTRYGDLERLRTLAPEIVEEIRYLNSSDATTRFGTGYAAGVILVMTKR